ncbi:uncharacterized protein SOCE26_082990 [Sorangium cellulosum]|uniref:Uncharacterized protein n=1 Tax=Sorangium cellulosum TaxID=56 RepID=A0A2L0F5F3_SORCE|nr:uncharacterized protein SOCE26_082990 [Sorangium cellulosum]
MGGCLTEQGAGMSDMGGRLTEQATGMSRHGRVPAAQHPAHVAGVMRATNPGR